MAVQLANPNDFPPLPSMDANPGSPAHSSQQLGQPQPHHAYMQAPFPHQQPQLVPQPSPSPHQQWPSMQHQMPPPPPQFFPHMHGYGPFPLPGPQGQFQSPQQHQQQLWAYPQMLYAQGMPPMPEYARADRPRTMSNPQQVHPHQMTTAPMESHQGYWSPNGPQYSTQPFVSPQAGPQRQPIDHTRAVTHSYDPAHGSNALQQPRRPHPTDPAQGYHPYRRPARSETAPPTVPGPEWPSEPPLHAHQPPYARPDAAGSATSVSSSSGGSSRTPAERHRTGSLQSNNGSQGALHSRQASQASRTENGSNHGRTASQASAPRPPPQHRRDSSSASERSVASNAASMTSAGVTQSRHTATGSTAGRPTKPSPLSKDPTYPDPLKRMSKTDDDIPAAVTAALARPAVAQATTTSDNAAAGGTEPTDKMVKSGGLKGRLRRALSFSAIQTLDEEDPSLKAAASRRKAAAAAAAREKSKDVMSGQDGSGPSVSSGASSSPPLTPVGNDDLEPSVRKLTKKPKRSLFRKGFNASTDNISLSSTASSASLMIRKLGGSVGNLARKASLANITGFLKDKNKDGDARGKGGAATASVSMATAEVDRGPQTPEEAGLSPAARLARQHTLRSNAEAAAKAQAAAEAARADGVVPDEHGAAAVPATWDRNTTKRTPPGTPKSAGRVPVLEDDRWEDDESEPHVGFVQTHEPIDEEESEPEEDELTIRMSGVSITDEVEPWAVGVRRSIERIRQPAKGILKNAMNYDQTSFEVPGPIRVRANSYGSAQAKQEPGPLARLPSADPDHIDGLQRDHYEDDHEETPSDAFGGISPAPQLAVDKPAFQYNHPNFNSSAPTLSTFGLPPLAQRAATAPLQSRRLAFATNLSVYSTFSSSVYDRRSEPATCNRLTPQLAQKIKEELNTYKMEEMEVHHASRIHTHFFV